MAAIYCIQNVVTGKTYVGLTTVGVSKRWNQHLRDAKRFDYPLYRAIRKYGADRFQVATLFDADCSMEELAARECAYIELLGSTNSALGYNQTHGGEGMVPTPEIRAKMRAAKLGTKRSPESCRKSGESHRLVPRTAAWKRNMSLAQRHQGAGVYFQNRSQKWHARICTDLGRMHVGLFKTEQEAIAARSAALAKENISA